MRLNLITASLVAGLALTGCKKKAPEPAPAAAAEPEASMKVVEEENTSGETKTLTKEEPKEEGSDGSKDE